MSKESNRAKALEIAKGLILKSQGKEAITIFDDDKTVQIDSLSTGCPEIDAAIGIGGIPKGRMTEIFGGEATGKTTIALHAIAETQRNGGVCAFIDIEHAINFQYSKDIGVNFSEDKMVFSQPDSGEDALEQVDFLVKSGAVDLIVVDSVDALVPREVLEKGITDDTMGLLARLMGKGCRRFKSTCSETGTAIIFINQIRAKMKTFGFGDPMTTSGGNALPFYASLRMKVSKGMSIKQGEEIIGTRTHVKIVKNKVAVPFKEAVFDLEYGKGISKLRATVTKAVELEIVEKSGSWYSYDEERIGQGLKSAIEFFEAHPIALTEIEEKIKEHTDD